MRKTEAIQRTRELYRQLNRLVLEWDPYGLSSAGEISDEFNDEVWQLLDLLCDVQTPEESIRAVQKVFSKAFSAPEFTYAACRDFGILVYHWWEQQQ